MDTRTMVDRLRRIEDKKDDLVERAERFFNERQGGKVVPVDQTQLQNLLRLALSTTSVKEMELFIRYQEARHKKWRDNNFGANLRKEIEELANESPDIKLDIVRLFIGYFVREARFRRPEGE